MTTIQILMLIAIFGHLLCGICDCLLIYTPSGKFGFQMMKDGDKMQEAKEEKGGHHDSAPVL